MLRHSASCRIAVFALGLVLLGPEIPALRADSGRAVYPPGLSFQVPQDLLAFLWDSITRLWNKEGCTIDPDGLKNGCSIDPNGLHKSGASLDNGCTIDPSGHCLSSLKSSAPLENGCTIDPNGLCITGTIALPTDNGCTVDPDGRCISGR
jgi:hypothetical protein